MGVQTYLPLKYSFLEKRFCTSADIDSNVWFSTFLPVKSLQFKRGEKEGEREKCVNYNLPLFCITYFLL